MPSQSNNNSQKVTEVSNNVREAFAPKNIKNDSVKYYKPWRTIQNQCM